MNFEAEHYARNTKVDPDQTKDIKIDNLERELKKAKEETARMYCSYSALMWQHADLMIQMLAREQIRELLDDEYAFNLPGDAHTDLRRMLNAQFEERARINRLALDTPDKPAGFIQDDYHG